MNPAKQDKPTPERRRELVLSAIDRIHAAHKYFRDVQSDASSDSDDRGAAKDRLSSTEREFSWQWRNVEVLLRGDFE